MADQTRPRLLDDFLAERKQGVSPPTRYRVNVTRPFQKPMIDPPRVFSCSRNAGPATPLGPVQVPIRSGGP